MITQQKTKNRFPGSGTIKDRSPALAPRGRVNLNHKKGKQKSPGRTTSRRPSQPLTPEGREKVTQFNWCIATKQMYDNYKDQLPLPQAR